MRKRNGKIPAQQGKVGYCNPPLETRWPPGVSGNPAGRPNAGAAVKEWWNQMQGWSLDQLIAVESDPAASAAKKAAAKQWVAAIEGSGGAVDRICDRTDGMPEQPVNHGGIVGVELRNCTTDELRTIQRILADAGRRAGRAVPVSSN